MTSLWDRISSWASEHKGVVYTVAGLTLVVSAGGVIYYLSDDKKDTGAPSPSSNKKKTKRDKRRAKERAEKEAAKEQEAAAEPKKASVAPAVEDELPHVDESTVGSLSEEVCEHREFQHMLLQGACTTIRSLCSFGGRCIINSVPSWCDWNSANNLQERKEYAAKLKAAGNKAYGSKDYNRAIDLYGQALLCKQDPVFYSNRAACWNAMSNWEKVIDDTTAAINLDNEYVKALNRRANAYEQVDRNSEALLDYTASCIIDGFRNESSAQSVERLLKKVAEV
ncbi:TOM (translocase of outer membrane) complex component [Paraconiothyrium brasiliense]|uniref:TOM (Translocase of outer membrane) complex component n=1 Tax=Paraconiothyrium brasiliense TaxID=300254 RepID=A0ABR3S2B1_9PLEO